jgi:hypothetical protein
MTGISKTAREIITPHRAVGSNIGKSAKDLKSIHYVDHELNLKVLVFSQECHRIKIWMPWYLGLSKVLCTDMAVFGTLHIDDLCNTTS